MRLIDADNWTSELEAIIQDESAPGAYKDYAMHLISEINSQPTAYDVDKVMEKIQDIMQDDSIRFCDQAVSRAVNIVKAGGIDLTIRTSSRQNVLNAIIDYISKHQYPPSVRELCDITGLKSTASVQRHIEALLKEGFLETDCGMGAPRALRVPGYKFVKEDA